MRDPMVYLQNMIDKSRQNPDLFRAFIKSGIKPRDQWDAQAYLYLTIHYDKTIPFEEQWTQARNRIHGAYIRTASKNRLKRISDYANREEQ